MICRGAWGGFGSLKHLTPLRLPVTQLMFGTRGMQLRATLPFYFSKDFLQRPAGFAEMASPDLEDLKGVNLAYLKTQPRRVAYHIHVVTGSKACMHWVTISGLRSPRQTCSTSNFARSVAACVHGTWHHTTVACASPLLSNSLVLDSDA